MADQQLVEQNKLDPKILEAVTVKGDLSGLNPTQKSQYYNAFCYAVGLNPVTQPFGIITLQGKEKLYAKREATEQLRKVNKVSITKLDKENMDGLYVVTAYVSTTDGRSDASTGAVNIKGVYGENLANAMMKAETKAKRRATLSICGLGIMDESEIDSVKEAKITQTEVTEPKKEEKKPEAPKVEEGEVVTTEAPKTEKPAEEPKKVEEPAKTEEATETATGEAKKDKKDEPGSVSENQIVWLTKLMQADKINPIEDMKALSFNRALEILKAAKAGKGKEV